MKRGSTSPPSVAEQAEETRRAKKKRSAEEERTEVIDKNLHNDQGVFLSYYHHKTKYFKTLMIMFSLFAAAYTHLKLLSNIFRLAHCYLMPRCR